MAKDGTKRVATYARVSTQNGRQDPETQLRELREFANRRGFKIMGEFIDHATGTTSDRTSYKRLFEAVRKRKVDVVLVWRYDRFARSTRALINAISKQLGIAYGTAWNYAKSLEP